MVTRRHLLNFTDPAEQARSPKELRELGKITVPSRSSYFGIVDLAGFKKDRFYIYQARWRPELPMAHILPHWNWPERVGQVTPVHVYTSGDEAELFLNGKSLGRKKREQNLVSFALGRGEVRTRRTASRRLQERPAVGQGRDENHWRGRKGHPEGRSRERLRPTDRIFRL